MLNDHGFDMWAGQYDEDVRQADLRGEYPFAGYFDLMNTIYGTVMENAPAKVLDIGFGTAQLTTKLYEQGNTITGLDFSAEMIKIASPKMPDAQLIQWDFSKGLPARLQEKRFDAIISTYALHHLPDGQRSTFLLALLGLLEKNGIVLVGDVSFQTRQALDACRKACGSGWDADEHYFVAEELYEALSGSAIFHYHPVSFCAGILELHPLPRP